MARKEMKIEENKEKRIKGAKGIKDMSIRAKELDSKIELKPKRKRSSNTYRRYISCNISIWNSSARKNFSSEKHQYIQKALQLLRI